MSLKDRLKSVQTPQNVKVQVEQPKYYASNIEAKEDSLGVVDNLLIDDELNSIFVSGSKNIYIEKNGKVYKSTSIYRDNVQLENIIKKNLQNEGYTDDEQSVYKFNYKKGINVVATLKPISNVPTLLIKCYSDKYATLQAMQEQLCVSKEIALVLEALSAISKNILIVGEKSSLKTALMSALIKQVPVNDRAIIIDNQNELDIDKQNLTTYNISKINNYEEITALLSAIFSSQVNKIAINNNDPELFSEIIERISENYRGLVISIEAKNQRDGIEKAARSLMKNNLNMSLEDAKAKILETFDVIIHVKKDNEGRRKIESISQINLLKDSDFIEDIFTIDDLFEHHSTGIIPEFYKDIKTSSLPVSDNIFDINYKHTYFKSIENSSLSQFGKKPANIDILKKFKKELSSQEENGDDSTNDVLKKAQEKFEELKKNAQMQTDLDEIAQSSNEEESNDEQNQV